MIDAHLVYFCICAVSLFAFILIGTDIRRNHK